MTVLAGPPTGESGPVTATQRGSWLLEQLHRDGSVISRPSAIELSGHLDVAALRRALIDVVTRHPALRTMVTAVADDIMQVVHEVPDLPLPVEDVTPADWMTRCREHVDRAIDSVAELPFDPLLLRMPGDRAVLCIRSNHMALDGWSENLLVSTLVDRYEAHVMGRAGPVEPTPVTLLDVAAADQGWATRRAALDEICARLTPLPPRVGLPPDRDGDSLLAGVVAHEVPVRTVNRVREVARAWRVTPFVLGLTALKIVLARHVGADDLAVLVPMAGRTDPAHETVLGSFVNELPVRIDVGAADSVRGLARAVRMATLENLAAQDVPIADVLLRLRRDHGLRGLGPFPFTFQLRNLPPPARTEAAGLRATPVRLEPDTVLTDLLVGVEPVPGGGWVVRANHRVARHDASTIARLLDRWEHVLAHICEHPEDVPSSVPLEPEAVTRAAQDRLDRRAAAPPFRPVTASVRDWASRRPDHPAVEEGDSCVTHADLARLVDGQAAQLLERGVVASDRVVVHLQPSLAAVATMLAVWTVGAVHVPLDPGDPADRLAALLERIDPTVVVTTDPRVLPSTYRDRQLAPVDATTEPSKPVVPEPVRPSDPAYVLFTSGSTGEPKAVQISHGAIANFAAVARQAYDFRSSDRVLAVAPLTFDATFEDTLLGLVSGGTIVLRPADALDSPQHLVECCDRLGITWLELPTAWFELVGPAVAAGLRFPSSVRQITVGGSKLPRATLRTWHEHAPGPELRQGYGPTEGTVIVTVADLDEVHGDDAEVPIGHVLPGCAVRLVDAGGLVPVGIVGELWISGAQLADGYLDDPDRTEVAFVTDADGTRWYRTGDLARQRDDDTLVFLGRNDRQLKRSGHRIEPGEVEHAARGLPGVGQAHVVLRDDRLVCYVAGNDLDAGAVLDDLRVRLPRHLLPSVVVPLPAMPLTPSGKVDVARLPTPTRTGAAKPYVPPRDDDEQVVHDVWCDILGLPQIGVHDSFFALGGSSLDATMAVTRLRLDHGVDLSVRDLFDAPTIAAVAGRGSPAPVGMTAEGRRVGPLAPWQRGLWSLHHLIEGASAQHIVLAWDLETAPDPDRLQTALDLVVARHAGLRVAFPLDDDSGPTHRITDATAPRVRWATAETRAAATHILREVVEAPFTLDEAPLLRAIVLAGPDGHRLAIVFQHLVLDGWSAPTLVEDLGQAYATGSLPPPSAGPTVVDVACSAVAAETADREARVDWWRRHLADRAPTIIPTDRDARAPAGPSARVPLVVESEVVRALDEVARQVGTTRFAAASALLAAMLHRVTGQTGLSFALASARRDEPGTEQLVGYLVDTLPLAVDVDGEAGFAALVAATHDRLQASRRHRDLGYDEIVRAVGASAAPGGDFLRVAISHLDSSRVDLQLGSIGATYVKVAPDRTTFDLSFHLRGDDGGLHGEIEYRADRLDRARVDALVATLEAVGRAVADDPATPLDVLPLRGRSMPAPGAPLEVTLLDRLDAVTVQHAVGVAVRGADEQLTYAALAERAGTVAAHLAESGVAAGDRVGLLLARSVANVVATVAVARLGAAYVPLDPGDPAAHRDQRLDAADVAVVLHAGADVPEDGRRWLDVRRLPARPAPPRAETAAGYVMFTSGSTGTPKGVRVPARAIVDLVVDTDYVDLAPGDVVGHLANPAFDAATFELWGPLLNGGTVAVIEHEVVIHPDRLAARLVADGVTSAFLTTSLFHLVAATRPDAFHTLRDLFVGGEPLDPAAAVAVLQSRPPGRLCNVYGPTETTTFASWFDLAGLDPATTVVPIGHPIRRTTLSVHDPAGAPVPDGVAGELWIGGPGVADGYLDGGGGYVSGDDGETHYRTGDRARVRPDGQIELLGRIDAQLKVRGFRIEPAEVERVITEHASVAAAAVGAVDLGTGDRRLAAWVVPASPVDERVLRAHVASRLPRAMVPGLVMEVERLPYTTGGKLDRSRLPRPGQTPAPPPPAGVESSSGTEAVVAAIIAGLLEADRVDPDADFFELGGHSLLAVRLLARLEREFGVAPPLDLLYGDTSVRRLAAWVDVARSDPDAGSDPRPQSHAAAGTPEVVLVHGAGGWEFQRFSNLAAALSPTFAVRRVDARGVDGRSLPQQDVTAMARDYVEDLRRSGTDRPLHLVGYSFGGLVALEMGRQLRAAGVPARLVTLLDTNPPLDYVFAGQGTAQERLARQRAELRGHRSRVQRARYLVDVAMAVVRREVRMHVARWALRLGLRVPSGIVTKFVMDAHRRAGVRYQPTGPYDGDVLLVLARDRADVVKRWEPWVHGPLSICTIDATHHELLDPEPLAQVVARLHEHDDATAP